MRLYVFPDTNALMHFKRPDQLDWKALAGTGDVVIVLSAVTLRELDKHAHHHPVGRLRDRARKLSSWLGDILDGQTYAVAINVQGDEPTAFLTGGLDPNVPDDRLVAAALKLAAEGKDVAVLTYDNVMRAKLTGSSIRAIKPRDEDRLKDEPDPREAENLKLKSEVAALTSRMPNLSLEWSGAGLIADVIISEPYLGEIASVEEKRATFPPMAVPESTFERKALKSPVSITDLADPRLTTLTSFQARKYNRALEEFFLDWERYRQAHFARQRTLARLEPLSFALKNSGTAVANAVRVTVNIPSGLKLVSSEKFRENAPQEPTPPIKPGDVHALYGQGGLGRRPDLDSFRLPQMPSNPNDTPYPHPTDGLVRLHRERIQHQGEFRFGPTYVLVDEALIGRTVEFAVNIIADEVAQPITSKLVWRIRRPTRDEGGTG